MSTNFLKAIDFATITPVRIWTSLPGEARVAAAGAFFEQAAKDDPLHAVIDAAIVRALRFRPESVRKMPIDKKAGYLAKVVHADDNLAAGLLQALHLGARRPLLSSFLDEVGVAHDNGHIDGEAKLERPPDEKVTAAAAKAYAAFPPEQVDVYFATLLIFDPQVWGGLLPILDGRKKS